MNFSKDPLVNSIYQGVKRDIQLTYDNECYGSFLILIYSGIDAMSSLSMPPQQDEVQSKDFIQWADKYMSPYLSDRITRVTGDELYSARCAVVHTYTIESRKTKSGDTRRIGYVSGGDQTMVWNSKVHPETILLRLDILRDAFFSAIDKFLIQSYADKQKQPILEVRLRKLLNTIPY